MSRPAGMTAPSMALYRFCRALVNGFCRLWFRMTVEGRENLPTATSYIVAPVHRSNLDTLIVGSMTTRRLRFMAKDSLFKKRLWAWFLSSLGGFPVNRQAADRDALRMAISIVEAGEPLVMFPEGSRRNGPIVQELFEGASYVAAKCQVPIVPVGIGGSERCMPKGSKFVYPRKVHVIIGKPIEPATRNEGRVARVAVREVTAGLHDELQQLFDTAQIRAGA